VSVSIKPLEDRIVVRPLEAETTTASGIVIPDTAKEKPSKGEIVAAGPGKTGDDGKRVTMAVKAGDTVLFNKYAGTEVKLDGVDHLVMREDDILAIIK
jgi:chaperonin GroES